ncbi:HAMP domain-containing protein, partial [Rhodovulum sp. PH10]|uniref:HAMP domain-containing protein n=1 Tax=Rhodovulum sp. PH10 TaxID=1187851 RepID=UPI00058DA4E7
MRITIKLKLAIAFAIVIVLSALTAWIGIANLASLDKNLTSLVDGPVTRQRLSLELSNTSLSVVRAEKNLITAIGREEIERFDAEVVKERQELLGAIEKAEATATTQGKPMWTAARIAVQQWIPVQDRIRAAMQQGNVSQARDLSSNQAREAVVAVHKSLGAIEELNRGRLESAKHAADEEYDGARSLMLGMVIGALVIAVAIAAWMALSISRGLARAGALAEAVALGDLSQKVEASSNDEIKDLIDALDRMTTNLRTNAEVADTIADGDLTVKVQRFSEKDMLGMALERMVTRLRQVVSESLGAADNVSCGSQQLSSAAEQLSAGATEQAASAEEASSSMEEMAANIKQNADNASQT